MTHEELKLSLENLDHAAHMGHCTVEYAITKACALGIDFVKHQISEMLEQANQASVALTSMHESGQTSDSDTDPAGPVTSA